MKKSFIVIVILMAANSAFAEPVITPYCEKAFAAGEPAASIEQRLNDVVDGLDQAYLMNLDSAQKQATKAALQKILDINPKKIDDFEKAAAAPCFMDMTEDERAQAGQDLKSQLGV